MNLKKILASVMTAGVMLSFVPTVSMADSAGWKGNNSDGWRYYTSDTQYIKSAWKQIWGKWYHFNASGIMETGWLEDKGSWYYLGSDGAALTDTWELIGNKLYHFNKNCAMDTNKWIDCGEYFIHGQVEEYCGDPEYAQVMSEYRGKRLWRYVGPDGAAYTGWKKVNGEWYHFNDTLYDLGSERDIYDTSSAHQIAYAVMTYGGYYDENEDAYYHFDGNGKYRKNCWYKGTSGYGGTAWYYYGPDGHAYSGWKKMNGKWYYFGSDDYGTNYMATGMREFYYGLPDKYGYATKWEIYLFKSSGEMITGWYKASDRWYYAGSNGSLYKDQWLYSGGKWYYFDSFGRMAQNATNYEVNGKGYDFDSTGACTNPEGRKLSGWYERVYDSRYRYSHYISDGTKEGGDYDTKDWSYIDGAGKKITDRTNYLIDGKYYDFDSKGICMNPHDGRTNQLFS